MKAIAIASAALAALLLAGCGGTPAGPVDLKQQPDGTYPITIAQGSIFSPKVSSVPAGATVVWVNEDGTAAHDVSAKDGSWSSDDAAPPGLGEKMGKGDTYRRTFTDVTVVEYVCRIHASTGMVGTLHVV